MHSIEKKDFGFKLTFADFIDPNEMAQWLEESRKALFLPPKEFGVFVDMRTLKALPQKARNRWKRDRNCSNRKG